MAKIIPRLITFSVVLGKTCLAINNFPNKIRRVQLPKILVLKKGNFIKKDYKKQMYKKKKKKSKIKKVTQIY